MCQCVIGTCGGREYLIEKDIFAVSTFGRKVFEVAVLIDAMFLAELLPELGADCYFPQKVSQTYKGETVYRSYPGYVGVVV